MGWFFWNPVVSIEQVPSAPSAPSAPSVPEQIVTVHVKRQHIIGKYFASKQVPK